jgi:hypothetical protein
MIDLRMVADDHGYMQLQSRSFCVQRGWTEWKSVPIVHDPTQLVDRVEIFDAKSTGAKPDGGLTGKQLAWWLKPDVGLTAKQLAEILNELEEARAIHLKNSQITGVNNERYGDHQQALADGISECLVRIRSKLRPQPAEPEIDL